MPVYKNDKNGTWYAMVRYKDWTGAHSKSAREDLRQGVRLWSGRHSSSCRKLLISI